MSKSLVSGAQSPAQSGTEEMPFTRRVFVSTPETPRNGGHKDLKREIISKIEEAGYRVELFDNLKAKSSMASDRPWSLGRLHQVVSCCVGAVIIGLPRWIVAIDGKKVHLASELCHLEGGVAYELDLPLFVLADELVRDRGIFKEGEEFFVVCVPRSAGAKWLRTPDFSQRFDIWIDKLRKRRDIFLGYCGCASSTARAVERFLNELGATVLDWKADFAPSNMILSQIKEAASCCSSAVFLFTKDDPIDGAPGQMAPRDNVLFEAGFFCHAKGQQRVLIIHEKGAKIPADLGGNIFASLDDRSDIGPIKGSIQKFLREQV
jgi:Predicted nucleotide-binding protein containing TIR-like domain